MKQLVLNVVHIYMLYIFMHMEDLMCEYKYKNIEKQDSHKQLDKGMVDITFH